jgi:hypothetical protein
MPLAQDLLTRIINVNWGEGLAVEFGDKDRGPTDPVPPPPTIVKGGK